MRELTLSLLLVACASSAHAATLVTSVDQTVYNVGDTITITVTGDAQGEFGNSVQGTLQSSDPSIAAIASGTPVQNTLLFVGSVPWATFPLACTASSCAMFDQFGESLIPASPSNLLVASVSFLASAPGTSSVSWQ